MPDYILVGKNGKVLLESSDVTSIVTSTILLSRASAGFTIYREITPKQLQGFAAVRKQAKIAAIPLSPIAAQPDADSPKPDSPLKPCLDKLAEEFGQVKPPIQEPDFGEERRQEFEERNSRIANKKSRF